MICEKCQREAKSVDVQLLYLELDNQINALSKILGKMCEAGTEVDGYKFKIETFFHNKCCYRNETDGSKDHQGREVFIR